jgi:hypothetical protein
MADLERLLVELGDEIDFPPAPAFARGIGAGIAAEQRSRRRRRAMRALALAVASFVLAVATAFAVPASREALLDWLGLEGATIERVVSLPEAPVATDLELGTLVSLADADRRAGYPVLVPSVLGKPDEVYVDGSGADARVTLVYAADEQLPESSLTGVGLLLTEFRGDVSPELIGKLAGQETVIEEVSVGGEPGFWLEGAPHELFYRAPNGDILQDSVRLAGNTLLWERGSLLLRLEANLLKAEALAVAGSVAHRGASR